MENEINFDDLPEKGQVDISFDDLPEKKKEWDTSQYGNDRIGYEIPAPSDYTGPTYAKEKELITNMRSYGMGKAGELPEPSTNMYDSFPKNEEGYKAALSLYNAYKNNEKSGIGMMGLTYKNKYVPAPVLSDFSDKQGPLGLLPDSRNVIGGISNAGKNIAVSVSSVLDSVAEALTGEKGGITQYLDENIPEWNAQGAADELVTTGTELAVGALIGKKISPQQVGLASKALGASLVAAWSQLTIDADIPTIATGENSLMNIFDGVSFDDPSYAQDIMSKKANQVLEAVGMEFGVGPVSKIAGTIGGLAKSMVADPLLTFFSDPAQERLVMKTVVQALEVSPDNPEALSEVRDILRSNKELSVELGMSEKPVATIERTTMSAISENAGNESKMGKTAMDLERGQAAKGSPLLETKVGQPLREGSDIQEAGMREYGGVQSTQQAAENIGQYGIRDIEALRQQAEQAKEAFKEAGRQFVRELEVDPLLGEEVKRLSDASGIDIFTAAKQTDAENQVIASLQQAVKFISEEKNRLYDAIPDGTPMDYESFSQALDEAAPYLNPKLRNSLAETVDGENIIWKELDFKTAHNQIVPELSASIGSALEKRDGESAAALIALKENIVSNQLDFIIENGDEFAASAAKTARTYYKDVYSPFANEGQTSALFDVYNMTNRVYEFDKKTLESVNYSMRESKRVDAKQLIDLSRSANLSQEQKDQIGVMLSSRLITKVLGEITPNNLETIDAKSLINKIKDEAGILTREFPQEAKKINDLVKNIESKQGNLAKQKEVLEEFIQLSKQEEMDMLDSAVGKFIAKTSGTRKLSTGEKNGFDVISSMLRDKTDGYANIKKLVDLAEKEKDPVVLQGLKSAYFRYVQEGMMSVKGIESTEMTKFLTPGIDSTLLKAGREMFRDEPEKFDNLRGVFLAIYNENAKRSGGKISVINPNQVNLNASASANLLITWTFGVLNPVASKIRSGTGALLRKLNPRNNMEAFTDEFYANPDYALELIEREIAKKGNQAFSPEFKDFVRRIAIRAGLIDVRDQTDTDFYDEFEKAEKEYLMDTQMDEAIK